MIACPYNNRQYGQIRPSGLSSDNSARLPGPGSYTQDDDSVPHCHNPFVSGKITVALQCKTAVIDG